MDYYNIVFNYIGVFSLLLTLFATGILILKRITADQRAQLILPAGSIFGVGLYIFLLNLTAHFIKGTPGFWFSLCLQIFLTIFITKLIPSNPLIFPKNREAKIWIVFIFFWAIFLYQITAHAITDGADSTLHQSFAARFIRGDYPMHTPWQPDYIAYYHFGGAEFLGSFHALTGAPYYFLHPFLAFWMLLFVSQILTWIFLPEKISIKSVFIASLPAFVGLISLGGYFIAWPVKLELPSTLKDLPTLNNALEVYGAPFNLDALVFFLHRFLATSFFISLLVLLLYPRKSLLTFFALAVYLATMALTDESVLTVTILPILIISYFNIFNKSIRNFVVSMSLIFFLILSQGGLVTETVLNRYADRSNILIFPGNHQPVTEKYLDYRLYQQKSKFYPASEKLKLLDWFHPGIVWQLAFYLSMIVVLFRINNNRELKILSLILLGGGIISFIAFHGLVPKGYTHPNGNRFLALSYYLSGIGLAYLVSFWLSKKNGFPKNIKILLNFLIIWILITSLIPPLTALFPRKKDNWFIIKPYIMDPTIKWVQDHISPEKRIVALTNIEFSNSMNLNLVKEAGMLTPMWPLKPRVHDTFDISPLYADLHYTLNPQAVKGLKIDYLVITNPYIAQLPKERQQDLLNKDFFTPIFTSSDKSTIILAVNPKFLLEGKNFAGTFTELDQIAPLEGSYCIDYPPNITEQTYRILRLLLVNRKSYCHNGGAFYNARIDITLSPLDEKLDQYDYFILGKDVDPQTVCHCQAKLIWTGLGNGIKFWQR